MNSKKSKPYGKMNDKTADPTVDDDNKSDTDDEYEYVIEEYEEEVIDGSGSTTPQVTISEAEAVKPVEVKQKAETVTKADKTRANRTLTSQEESILLPLIQGLLAANNFGDQSLKRENTPLRDKETSNNKGKNSKSISNQEHDKTSETDSTDGSNILSELSMALHRLEGTILEDKDAVADARKRNTILTLVAWLKRILQTPAGDSSTSHAEAQLLSLTELLPTELLLTKLMPQLNDVDNSGNDDDESAQSERSPASSKRFVRQGNKRFNTVGVSKEELADARLYLQKKLLSENLASSSSKLNAEIEQQNILDDSDDSRRKSLNLSITNALENDIDSILNKTKKSFSKSIEIVPAETNLSFSKTLQTKNVNQTNATEQQVKIINDTKVVMRRKSSSSNHNQLNNRIYHDVDPNPTTDTDDDQSENIRRKNTMNNNAPPSSNANAKPMNKFAARKLKMKRANTIDIPKNNNLEELNSDSAHNDDIKNRNKVTDDSQHEDQSHVTNDVDKNHLPQFQVKSTPDQKFLAFLNREQGDNRASWMNPNKAALNAHQKSKQHNWSSKFGNIKNSFERADSTAESPRLNKTNNFTHASTSPFQLVQNNTKPPQIPNGYHHHYNNQQVLQKVATIQNNQQQQQDTIIKPQLRPYKSVPSYTESTENVRSYQNQNQNTRPKPNTWQPSKYQSVDSYVSKKNSPNLVSSSYNPLYVPLGGNVKPKAPMQPLQPPQLPLLPPPIQQQHQSPIQINPVFDESLNNNNLPNNNQLLSKKAPVSPIISSDFPAYTYTSTDYTQPLPVSTYAMESNKTPPIRTTILPDDSYLKQKSSKAMPPPLLGSSRLSKQMKTIDLHSSSEYLSEPSSCYRSPQPFSPNYEYDYTSGNESHRDSHSQEFTATTQIMRYPQTQTATYVSKAPRYDQDDEKAKNLRTFLTNNVRQNHNQLPEPKIETNPSISPISETNFSHVNQTYVPPVSAPPQTIQPKPINNFVSMENISSGKPIRLRNDTSHYSSHAALFNQKPTEFNSTASHTPPALSYQPQPVENISIETSKPKSTSAMKLNSLGSEYEPPKIESIFTNPNANNKFGRKPMKLTEATNGTNQNNVIKNNVTNLNRSSTITHKRIDNYEIKRKQSLPGQRSDYFDAMLNMNNDHDEWNNDMSAMSHSYLPSGALKKSKSSHTLALLQRFEDKSKNTNEIIKSSVLNKALIASDPPNPLPSYIKTPTISSKPVAPILKPKLESKPLSQEFKKSLPELKQPLGGNVKPKALMQPLQPPQLPLLPPPIQQQPQEFKSNVEEFIPKPQEIISKLQENKPKVPEIKPKSILTQPKPIVEQKPKAPPKTVSSTRQLNAPEITETPSSPLVEDGHIIYPGQTVETRNRVQHYAQTLNAILNRKSIVCDDDEEEEENITSTPAKGALQKSKSGTLLSIPKQYESAIKKSEVEHKERTVAAYFGVNKSPQGLQRSSSQHSVLSSSSMKSTKSSSKQELFSENTSITPESGKSVEQANKSFDNNTSSSMTTSTSTTTKSAHHLKILRKQQQSSSMNMLAKSSTMPSLNLLDESNVDDAFEDLFASFNK